ncbi:hypothetical protein JRQ81_011559 [Phrynocephalus forsythii]|uniref:Ig-like domain-containing protein n=1 Tax=Phrynocephalus forsythii TaxID=171643 RepID=A0A9Q0X6E7_9SAUR|nr:hypothetical protein JRQ81_011559 [Phrynocephalus forsythii]
MSPKISSLQQRATFTGNLNERKCDLTISQLQKSDGDKYGARLYGTLEGKTTEDKWIETIHVDYLESPPVPRLEIYPKEMKEGQRTTVTCSMTYYQYHCPEKPISMTIRMDHRSDLEVKTLPLNNREVRKQLTFSPTWEDDDRLLTCSVMDQGRKRSQSSRKLDVKHAPKVELIADSGTTLREGEKLSLECLVKSSNPADLVYQWWKNDHRIDGGIIWNRMEIDHVGQSQSGRYKCKAKNKVGTTESEELTIDVQYPPKETKSPFRSRTIKENDTITLECSFIANPPITKYEWYKQPASNIISSRTQLHFQAIQPSDSGTYYCKAWNPIGWSSSSLFTLDVFYKPKDVHLAVLNPLPITEGQNIIFNCSVGSSNPRTNQHKLLENDVAVHWVTEPNRITVIAKPQRGTTYSCEVCNIIGCTVSLASSVNVHFAPQNVQVVQNPTGQIKEGSFLKLSCQMDKANPEEITYRWHKDQQRLVDQGAVLTIHKVTPEDSGYYSCHATNSVGTTDSEHLRLKVRYGPRNVTVSLKTKEAITEGKDVQLQCENDAYPLSRSYKWYWNGEQLFQKNSPNLELLKVQVWQSGEYLCTVSNEISEKESQPMVLIVSYSRATVIKHTLISLGSFLAMVVLVGLLVCVLRRRKKTIDLDTSRTGRSGSFFVKKAKGGQLCDGNSRPNDERREGSLGFLNQGAEDTITYAAIRLPPSLSNEQVIYSRIKYQKQTADPPDENAVYSVVKKPELPRKEDSKPDYENIVSPNEEELHYSSLVNLALRPQPAHADSETDSDSEYSIHYAYLKH